MIIATPAYVFRRAVSPVSIFQYAYAITFPSVSGTFVESPAGKWGAGVGYGVSNQTLRAGIDGWLQSEYQGVGYQDTVLGLDTDNTLENYASFTFGVFVSASDSNYNYIFNGSITNASIPSAPGDLMRINRTGGTITADYSRNSGGSWVNIFTFTTAFNGTMYCKGSVAGSGNYLLNPKGVNIL